MNLSAKHHSRLRTQRGPVHIDALESRQMLSVAPKSVALKSVALPQPAAVTAAASGSARRVVGYLPEYRSGFISRIDMTALTHLNYFSVEPTSNGGLDTSNISLTNLAAARNRAHAAGVTVSITVGPESALFTSIAGNTTRLNKFVADVITFVEANDLDGIDIDWEPPAANSDKPLYGTLIDALYAAAHPKGLLLSAAVNPITTEIPVVQANKLDWINIMGYDFDYANHSTYDAGTQSLRRWNNYGVTKDKLVLGVPFYSRKGTSWNNSVSETYGNLMSQYFTANGSYPSPATDVINGQYFNGPTTIAAKAQFVLDNDFGGVMIWELGQDQFTSNGYGSVALTPVIKNVIQPVQATVIDSVSTQPTSGGSGFVNESKAITVNVGAHVRSTGVMQVSLVRGDGSVAAQDFHVVTATSNSYTHAFALSPTESSAATRDYSLVVRFRPNVALGPITGVLTTDVVTTSTYRIVWQPARDLTAPTVSSRLFFFEGANEVRFAFSENVGASVAAGDVIVRRVSDDAVVSVISAAYDTTTNTARFVLPTAMADGDYTATLAAGSVADAAGNVLANASTLEFFAMRGDANRDRKVDFQDLVILAQNYGLTGRTFAQGNIDGSSDGAVDFLDLVLLAQQYGHGLDDAGMSAPLIAPQTTVAPPVTAAPTSPAATKKKKSGEAVLV